MATIWGISIFGCATQAWVATLGPKYGLRTMALSRVSLTGCTASGGVPSLRES